MHRSVNGGQGPATDDSLACAPPAWRRWSLPGGKVEQHVSIDVGWHSFGHRLENSWAKTAKCAAAKHCSEPLTSRCFLIAFPRRPLVEVITRQPETDPMVGNGGCELHDHPSRPFPDPRADDMESAHQPGAVGEGRRRDPCGPPRCDGPRAAASSRPDIADRVPAFQSWWVGLMKVGKQRRRDYDDSCVPYLCLAARS
jgi:hypothetical protein